MVNITRMGEVNILGFGYINTRPKNGSAQYALNLNGNLIMKTKLKSNHSLSTIIHSGIVAIGLIGALIVIGPAAAASACKGLDNSTCNANAACGWVDGYERKDGRSVKSFCRTKSVSKKVVKKNSVTKRSVAKNATASRPSK